MKYITALCVGAVLSSQALFGAYNDRCYEGVNPAWKTAETVNGRLEIISLYLPPNPTVFEVGAKDGSDSVTLAQKWPLGKIISFEANPNQFSKYQEKAKSYENMFGYNLAVNTYNGEATFYLCWGTGGKDPIFEGASSLLEPSDAMKEHYMGPKITVPCVVFDDWCCENGVKAVDFMWLDLEGFELQLLKSSPEILKTVQVIHAETNFFDFRKGMTKFKDLMAFLQLQGFTIIAHWYNEGLLGDAVFVRNTTLENVRAQN